ncbi:MAG: hypothetical protein K2X82_15815 [Gemmataceae bacterium]|nr:hypothetical protein [Gemmataceae bacterium]
MVKKRKKPPERDPKGGKKHTPGRDHDSKSRRRKDRRRVDKARRRREELDAEARRQWKVWDALGAAEQKMLPELRPTVPRPSDAANP